MEGKGLWNPGKEGHCLLGRLEGAFWVWGAWASPPLSPSVAQLLEAWPCWWEDPVTSGWIFPWVGLSRRQMCGLIIAEMLIHPLPSPLLPPCHPGTWRCSQLVCILIIFHRREKKTHTHTHTHTKGFWSSWRDESVISWNGRCCSCARLLAIPWTAAYQAPPSLGFSRQEYWSGVPLPSPNRDEGCC